MNAAKGTQKVTQTGPDAFHGVAMDFTDTLAIVITGPFPLRMTDRAMPPTCPSHSIVGVTSIRVEGRRRLGLVFDFRLNGVFLLIIYGWSILFFLFHLESYMSDRLVEGRPPMFALNNGIHYYGEHLTRVDLQFLQKFDKGVSRK